MASTFTKLIALSGALDEISTASGAIARYVNSQGTVRDGATTKPVLFVVYQTEKHGPQNGYRLLLVREGCKPGVVEELVQARGSIEAATAESIVVEGKGLTVLE